MHAKRFSRAHKSIKTFLSSAQKLFKVASCFCVSGFELVKQNRFAKVSEEKRFAIGAKIFWICKSNISRVYNLLDGNKMIIRKEASK